MFIYIGPIPDWDEEKQVNVPEERDVTVRIDNYDTWSVDHTLALIIPPLLRQLKETTHGYPVSFNSSEEWDEVLDKMIWSFDQMADDDHEQEFFTHYGEMELSEPDEHGNVHVLDTGVNCDADGLTAHWEKIQEGLDLFGKYYTGLWD